MRSFQNGQSQQLARLRRGMRRDFPGNMLVSNVSVPQITAKLFGGDQEEFLKLPTHSSWKPLGCLLPTVDTCSPYLPALCRCGFAPSHQDVESTSPVPLNLSWPYDLMPLISQMQWVWCLSMGFLLHLNLKRLHTTFCSQYLVPLMDWIASPQNSTYKLLTPIVQPSCVPPYAVNYKIHLELTTSWPDLLHHLNSVNPVSCWVYLLDVGMIMFHITNNPPDLSDLPQHFWG